MDAVKLLIVFFLGTVFGASMFLILTKPDAAHDPAYQMSQVAQTQTAENKSKDNPKIEDAKAKMWAVRAISESLSFNFDNHAESLARSKRFFTEQGWNEFEVALKKERLIERVEANTLTVRTQPKSVPKLISSGEENGVYKWVVQIPVSSNFMLEQRATTSDATITLTLIRTPQSASSSDGLAIEHWDGMPR